jgi:hypothetical protein
LPFDHWRRATAKSDVGRVARACRQQIEGGHAMSTQGYTIYLLKDVVKSLDAALDPEKNVTRYNLSNNLGFTGALFVGNQNQSQPSWVELLNPHLETAVERAFSANISAALLVNHENRIFAVTFGYGKGLLASSSWVRDFGLKVTFLNPKTVNVHCATPNSHSRLKTLGAMCDVRLATKASN